MGTCQCRGPCPFAHVGSAGTGTKAASQFANVEAPVVLLICPHISSHAEDVFFFQDFASVYRVALEYW